MRGELARDRARLLNLPRSTYMKEIFRLVVAN